jgi:hypothetical protein
LQNPDRTNLQNVADPYAKPSDSTKRIIEALKAQISHTPSESSLNYINDIIVNQSMALSNTSMTSNSDNFTSADVPKSEIESAECSVTTSVKTMLKPTRLFPPPPKITVTSPVDTKPFLPGTEPGILISQSNNSQIKQTTSPVQIVSPTQVVHPIVTTSTALRDTVPPKMISITQAGTFPPPAHRMLTTQILHKPAAIVHPASSPTLARLKKVDQQAGELGPVVVITPQTQGLTTQTPGTTAYIIPSNTDLRSPDSGFNETCVSPADPSLMVS